MKQLRYLVPATLFSCFYEKNEIGEPVESRKQLETYDVYSYVQLNEAQPHQYGATLRNTYRLSSVRNELEQYLLPRMTYNEENSSKYKIYVNDKMCTIKTVKDTYLDVTYV